MRHLQAKSFAVVLTMLLAGAALSACQSTGNDYRYIERQSYGP
jgi:hypothetical protein